jgi:hypothetical protein
VLPGIYAVKFHINRWEYLTRKFQQNANKLWASVIIEAPGATGQGSHFL